MLLSSAIKALQVLCLWIIMIGYLIHDRKEERWVEMIAIIDILAEGLKIKEATLFMEIAY